MMNRISSTREGEEIMRHVIEKDSSLCVHTTPDMISCNVFLGSFFQLKTSLFLFCLFMISKIHPFLPSCQDRGERERDSPLNIISDDERIPNQKRKRGDFFGKKTSVEFIQECRSRGKNVECIRNQE
jgi:hypothetical protein